jgi:hypothetical protein
MSVFYSLSYKLLAGKKVMTQVQRIELNHELASKYAERFEEDGVVTYSLIVSADEDTMVLNSFVPLLDAIVEKRK